jgi:hypothetical protein
LCETFTFLFFADSVNLLHEIQLIYQIGYGDPSNTTILKHTISDVYLFGPHVSTLILGHLQAVEVYTKVIWFTPTYRDPFGIVYI